MRCAVDTNVVVRLLVDDGSGQMARARRVFEGGLVTVPASVILETEWVLRSAFGVPRKTVCEAFLRLVNMENVEVESRNDIEQAVALHAQGFDFADALHLQTSKVEYFVTFDKMLVKMAKKIASRFVVRHL